MDDVEVMFLRREVESTINRARQEVGGRPTVITALVQVWELRDDILVPFPQDFPVPAHDDDEVVAAFLRVQEPAHSCQRGEGRKGHIPYLNGVGAVSRSVGPGRKKLGAPI